MFKFKRSGFTLIEVMIVVAIISILAVIGGANYITSLKRSRDARRMADLEQVRAALEMFKTDAADSLYPISASAVNFVQNYEDLLTTLTSGSTIYLKSSVNDPLTSQNYVYLSADGKNYELCADLEQMTVTSPCTIVTGYYGVQNP